MTTYATARLTFPVSERDHIQGPVTAAATLVEYGDYQCPYCGQVYPVVEALREQLGDQLQFAFRHFPLTQVHPHAQLAAETAEAAGRRASFGICTRPCSPINGPSTVHTSFSTPGR
jgi:protein-disulfide isomerase